MKTKLRRLKIPRRLRLQLKLLLRKKQILKMSRRTLPQPKKKRLMLKRSQRR